MFESMDDVFGSFQKTAARSPGSIAIASRAGFLNYERFVGNIDRAAAAATKSGIKPGQLVVLALANPDMALIVALALMRIGCRVGYSQTLALYDFSGIPVDAVIVDKSSTVIGRPVIVAGADWFAGAAAGNENPPPVAAESSIIFATSGSTGQPKLVEWSHVALLHRAACRSANLNPVSRARCLTALGNTVGGAFMEWLSILECGGTIIRPADRLGPSILDAIQVFCPDYLTLAPATLRKIIQSLKEKPRALTKVRMVRTTGAYCPPDLQTAALELIAREVVSNYGAREVGWVAGGNSIDTRKVERSVGRIFDGVEVATFDGQGQRLPVGAEGEIRVKVPDGVAGTYLGKFADQQSTFTAGWFSTGDLGLVDDERNLIIRGRATNVINLGGNKVSPELFEGQISALAAVLDVGVTGLETADGSEFVCAAIVSSSALTLEDINAHLRQRKVAVPVHVVKNVPAIPKTDNGKIDRVALKRLCAG